ncbi:MAG: deaminase, partial [Pseudonocardiales bacterium]
MTRVRIDLFVSLDGYTSAGQTPDNPMGEDWGRLTAAYAATRTFHERVFGDTSGTGTTGIDDSYAAAHFEGIGAEIMGAAMFGLHTFP